MVVVKIKFFNSASLYQTVNFGKKMKIFEEYYNSPFALLSSSSFKPMSPNLYF